MPLLIDGHNLIGSGALPGISLADEDDELLLVRLLRRYRSRVRSDLTVVFDGGIPGGPSPGLSGGGVSVVFAPSRKQSADDLIIGRLRRAAQPDSLTVVTSDFALAATARRAGAHVVSAAEFAARLLAPLPDSQRLRAEPLLPTEEVDEWLSFFGMEQEGNQLAEEAESGDVRAVPAARSWRRQRRGT